MFTKLSSTYLIQMTKTSEQMFDDGVLGAALTERLKAVTAKKKKSRVSVGSV